MSVEIERKFVVSDIGATPAADRAERIRQGYVAVDPAGTEVRVREIAGRRLLTVKHGTGEIRAEVEFEIDAATFEELWELTGDRRIDKERLFIAAADGRLVYELDLFAERLAGLATVEVEFATPEDSSAFEPPAWFGREVTGDVRYANARLAIDGPPG